MPPNIKPHDVNSMTTNTVTWWYWAQ